MEAYCDKVYFTVADLGLGKGGFMAINGVCVCVRVHTIVSYICMASSCFLAFSSPDARYGYCIDYSNYVIQMQSKLQLVEKEK